MTHRKYWISELAELANVSHRTIRYYIQEGLLPRPTVSGKYAEFTDAYVNRLQLIKVLKDAYLPLNRIREVMDALKDDKVVPLLEEFEKDPVAALAGLQALPVFNPTQTDNLELNSPMNDSALSYIHSLRESAPFEKIPSQTRVHAYRQVPPLSPRVTEEWQRIPLAPGLELHVRQPVRPRLQALIDKVIEMFDHQNPFHREEQ
jgi:DNA-binding transcriptional MerR regulator